jgi:8-oxo-dGTP diphosphatase
MSLALVVLARNLSSAMVNSVKEYINVAVGILLDLDSHILLTQRQSHQPYSDFWEFPGGKLEVGEDAHVALSRELFEEVGVSAINPKPLLSVQHHYPELSVRLHVFVVDKFEGVPFSKEGQNLIWRTLDNLADLKLLPANDVILLALHGYMR